MLPEKAMNAGNPAAWDSQLLQPCPKLHAPL